jgi:hypothetical protein
MALTYDQSNIINDMKLIVKRDFKCKIDNYDLKCYMILKLHHILA